MNLSLTLVILIASSGFTSCNQIDASRSQRQRLVRKHLKHLRKEDGAIRLVGGQSESEGNIEIFHNGRWGNICDDEWDKYEAEVVCRQLGFTRGGKATHSGAYGNARRKFWMDNLFCTGREKELSDCRFDGWGSSDCDHSEAAGVVCVIEKNETTAATAAEVKQTMKAIKLAYKSREPMEIRLVGGRVPEEGRVEVRFGESGDFGDICADGWSQLEANVICQQLNLGYANQAFQTDFFGGSNGTNVILSGTACVGNETQLSQCKFDGFGRHAKCHGNQRHVAGVSCVEKMADLIIDERELETTAHLEDRALFFLTCAMEENCLASQAYEIQKENQNWHIETRRLLKFTAKVLNDGTDDFRPHIPKNLWEFHLCHM
jgi:lysyl oxidase-like protein 2/3/4